MLLLAAHPHFTSLLDSIFKRGNWLYNLSTTLGFPWCCRGKESACQYRRCGFRPWVGKIPWRREWQPTPGLLPRESRGQRSLAGYSPWGCKELDTTEWLLFLLSLDIKLVKTVHIVWTSIKRADVKERDPLLPVRESEYQSECRNETSVNMKDCNSLGTGMPKRSLYISKLYCWR